MILEGYPMNYLRELKKCIRSKILFNEPLAKHTTFKIGGPARAWVEPENLEDLKRILKFSRDRKIRQYSQVVILLGVISIMQFVSSSNCFADLFSIFLK